MALPGDVMLNWFSDQALRVSSASQSTARSAEGDSSRMDDLLGTGTWTSTKTGEELTTLFCERVTAELNRRPPASFTVHDQDRKRYTLLLFPGNECPADLPDKWCREMTRRFPPGLPIDQIIDVVSGRQSPLPELSEETTPSKQRQLDDWD